jgi:hypothetical protein
MRHLFSRCTLAVIVIVFSTVQATRSQDAGKTAETYVGKVQVAGLDAASSTVTIQIERYIDDYNRKIVREALRTGGFPGFLPAFRKAPVIGSVDMAGHRVPIRWAHKEPAGARQVISIVTDGPLYFVGGGKVDAKPRAGFEVAVIRLDVDGSGSGTGTLAAAARVKPGGSSGVEIDDYADKPLDLTTVQKSTR